MTSIDYTLDFLGFSTDYGAEHHQINTKYHHIHEDFALTMRMNLRHFHSNQFTHRYCIFLTGGEDIYLIGIDTDDTPHWCNFLISTTGMSHGCLGGGSVSTEPLQ